ncbi:MAG TPA: hypothetical protein VFS36_06440 [Chitinophagaceae bacterium]|nr:hypothetical protein [Chitinophagaceae bacterium]
MRPAILLLIIILTGCLTPKKVARWNNEHPEEEAANCAAKYPCQPGDTTIISTVDSTGYLQSIQDLESSVLWLNQVNDSLLDVIAKDTAKHQDSGCTKYAPVIKKQAQEIASLKYQLRNIPPIVITDSVYVPYIDSAPLTALRLALDKEQAGRQKAEKELMTKQGQANTRLWMFIASAVLNLLLIILLFRKKSSTLNKIL